MSESSEDDFQPQQTSPGRQSAKDDDSAKSGTASDSESEDGEGSASEDIPVANKATLRKALREWQLLAEYSREEYDTDESDDNIYKLARDEIKPKLSTNAYRILKQKANKAKHLHVWKLRNSRDLKQQATKITDYSCPMRDRCKCMVGLRVARTPSRVSVSISGNHSMASHEEHKGTRLTLTQRGEIAKLVRAQPASHTGQIRRQLQESSPAKKVPLAHRRSVARAVKAEHRIMREAEGETIVLDPAFGSLHALCEKLFLPKLLKR